MAILTVHHWDDWERGSAEMCRVAPRRLVLGIDFEVHAQFWLLQEYLPSVLEHTLACGPPADAIAQAIGATTSIALPTYADLQDGVLGAHWSRPEAYLSTRSARQQLGARWPPTRPPCQPVSHSSRLDLVERRVARASSRPVGARTRFEMATGSSLRE